MKYKIVRPGGAVLVSYSINAREGGGTTSYTVWSGQGGEALAMEQTSAFALMVFLGQESAMDCFIEAA